MQVGTPNYHGPEGNSATELQSYSFDIFSFGATLLYILDCGSGAHRTLAKDMKADKSNQFTKKALNLHFGSAQRPPQRDVERVQCAISLALDCMRPQTGQRVSSTRRRPGPCPG